MTSYILQFILVTGGSFAVFLMVTAYVRYDANRTTQKSPVLIVDAPEQNLQRLITESIQRAEKNGSHLILYRIHPDTKDQTMDPDICTQQKDDVEEHLQKELRSNSDIVIGYNNSIAVLIDTHVQFRGLLQNRLQRILNQSGYQEFSDEHVQWDRSIYPVDGRTADQLMASAMPVRMSKESSLPVDDALLHQVIIGEKRMLRTLKKQIGTCAASKTAASLLYLRIDYLDRYISHYGKDVLPMLKRQLGRDLGFAIRKHDVAIALDHGDMLIFSDVIEDHAKLMAQRIIGHVKDMVFTFNETPLKLTISIGINHIPSYGISLKRLLTDAIGACSEAGKRGGNRYYCYELEQTVRRESMPASNDVF